MKKLSEFPNKGKIIVWAAFEKFNFPFFEITNIRKTIKETLCYILHILYVNPAQGNEFQERMEQNSDFQSVC